MVRTIGVLIATITTAAGLAGGTVRRDHTYAKPAASIQAHGHDGNGSAITIINPDSDPGWVPVVAWAEAAFATHSLALPPVSVDLRADLESCDGKSGYYQSTPRSLITICAPHKPSDEMVISNRMHILHELAHAWAAEHLDDTTRERFMQLRHIDNWNDKQQPWGNRGTEQAADVIASTLVYGTNARGTQICGYELLTNTPPPFELAETCT